MKAYNVVIVFDQWMDKILMCYRTREPYLNLYNLPGGKVEENESVIESAYRELEEETGIEKDQIKLKALMSFKYKVTDISVEAFVGCLKEPIELREEIHPLEWISIDENFFDMNRFAGMGNIGHMMEEVTYHKERLFG